MGKDFASWPTLSLTAQPSVFSVYVAQVSVAGPTDGDRRGEKGREGVGGEDSSSQMEGTVLLFNRFLH